MSNQPAPTMIETDTAVLPFQTWFVRQRWQPPVRAVQLPPEAMASHAVALALQKADIVLIAPSNPFVSIDPILNCYPIRANVMDLPRAVVAVSPIIGQAAVKGPAAKMMQERGMAVSATAVADYYDELIDGFVYDVQDKGQLDGRELATLCNDTLMTDSQARRRVAEATLAFAAELAG
jgi:LPPG:FO 2-phospho-L-lactate transferase